MKEWQRAERRHSLLTTTVTGQRRQHLEMREVKALGFCGRATQPSCHQHAHRQHPPCQWPIYYGLLLIWHRSLQRQPVL